MKSRSETKSIWWLNRRRSLISFHASHNSYIINNKESEIHVPLTLSIKLSWGLFNIIQHKICHCNSIHQECLWIKSLSAASFGVKCSHNFLLFSYTWVDFHAKNFTFLAKLEKFFFLPISTYCTSQFLSNISVPPQLVYRHAYHALWDSHFSTWAICFLFISTKPDSLSRLSKELQRLTKVKK